ncbi:MAG: hypothetical protein Q7S69_10595 [Nitrosomonadaceae bacterium]|nr:hypothetical protein [Nitrosomonadaceae bacterium]
MIDQLRHQHPVTKLCDLLNVAKSGYQAWSTGKVVPPRKLEDMRVNQRRKLSTSQRPNVSTFLVC